MVDANGKLVPAPEVSLISTWKAMEKLYRAGLLKSIGVSNFNAKQLEDLCMQAEVRPHNLQVVCLFEKQ